MNILFVGCSYGVPNYFGSPGVAPEYHTEYLLRKMGYTVHNCAGNGSSNLDAFDRLEEYVAGRPISDPANRGFEIQLDNNDTRFDWVVWFHTEILRDYLTANCNGSKINTAIELLYHKTYKRFFEISNRLNLKTAVIGGCSEVSPIIYEYGNPTFVIHNWISRLLGQRLPTTHLLSQFSVVEDSPDTIEDKHLFINNSEEIMSKIRGRPDLFPDRGHPGIGPHRDLSEQLDRLFKL